MRPLHASAFINWITQRSRIFWYYLPSQHYGISKGEDKEGKLAKVDKILDRIKNKMDKKCARKLDYLREKVTGTWLTVTPNNLCSTVLPAIDFRDELKDQYRSKLWMIHHITMAATRKFRSRMLLAIRGDLIHSRHDESRDSLGSLTCTRF